MKGDHQVVWITHLTNYPVGRLLALMGVLYYVQTNFPNLGIMEDEVMVGLVLVGVVLAGILISWISTFIATQRFLNLRTDDLY